MKTDKDKTKMYEPLLPIIVDTNNPSFKAVEELSDVLENSFIDKKIKNIALTGPFGSGKSSILQTLQKISPELKYLPISLATLQSNEETGIQVPSDDTIETLNRKIEYSILQQLIYREKGGCVPNSRLRRITHLTDRELTKYSIFIIILIISILIVFEPSLFKVDTISSLFDFGQINVLFDLLSSAYIIWALFEIIKSTIQSYCNSKLNKLNLKDGEIEVVDNNSIFNKHLDEILYFFQVTDYNVVIIEDLDRFGTPNIFLKLRELNFLINESKIVSRHIVFLYAVKDDIFKNEERTKFFDYIVTIIPVINPSNSIALLKKAVIKTEANNGEISDDDLSEMAFFIQDMRILRNIANEYWQYREKLCSVNKQKLNLTNLLAMIVYKNYYPNDFALLHKRGGKIYSCISSKRKFIDLSINELKLRRQHLEDKKKLLEGNWHLQTKELKLLFLYEISRQQKMNISSIYIKDEYHAFDKIADNNILFEELKNQTQLDVYYCFSQSKIASKCIDFSYISIDKSINFTNRLNALEETKDASISKELEQLWLEELKLRSLKLKDIISKYHIGKTNDYIKIGLSPLMDVFIRRGYLDEDYYDYISYFYEGMISPSDRELLLSIKIQKREDYSYQIDKTENFVKELKPYMFEDDAIFNNELLDFLCKNKSGKNRDFFDLIMNRLKRFNAPFEFLAQYYIYGKFQKVVFTQLIEWDKDLVWQQIQECENSDQIKILTEAYLKYAGVLNEEQQVWLNNNFDFIIDHAKGIGISCCTNLISHSLFNQLSDRENDLLDCVINYNSYLISTENLILITSYINNTDEIITSNKLNYTLICSTNMPVFIDYINTNIEAAINCFKDSNKDESTESILYIFNNNDLELSVKESYLENQKNFINKLSDLNDDSLYDLAIKLFIIKPTWENISDYYQFKGSITDKLIKYICKFDAELSALKYDDSIENRESIFIALFGVDDLPNKEYTNLLSSFDLIFVGFDNLKDLSKDKLIILLNDDRLPFSEKNVSIINKTSILAEYLIHYSEEFVEHLEWEYSLSQEVVSVILQSDRFDINQKRAVIEKIPKEILLSSGCLSEIIIRILVLSGGITLDYASLCVLISNASQNILDLRVRLASLIVEELDVSESQINGLINALGYDYIEILDKSKRATVENNDYNKEFLELLKKKDIISSFKEEKDNTLLRVYHKNIQN